MQLHQQNKNSQHKSVCIIVILGLCQLKCLGIIKVKKFFIKFDLN